MANEEKGYKSIPVVKQVSPDEIRGNYEKIKAEIADLISKETKTVNMDPTNSFEQQSEGSLKGNSNPPSISL